MFYTEGEAASNRMLVETRVTAFQNRMRRGFPDDDPFLKSHSERSIQSLLFLLVSISVLLALITPLRAQPGALDPTFNPILDLQSSIAQNSPSVSALAPQTDNKLVVGGYFHTVNGVRRVALLRLLADGTLDPDYQQRDSDGGDVFSSITSLVMQADDRVVAGGWFSAIGRYGVARFNSDGTRDTSYDPSTDPNPFEPRQSDGKRLIVRQSRIDRLNADGSPDPSFNSVSFGLPNPTNITAVAVQPNDRIIVAYSTVIGGGHVFRVERDGSPDNSFTPAFVHRSVIQAIAVQPDGRICIGGYFTNVNDVPRSRLARLIGDTLAERPQIISQPVQRFLRMRKL